MGMRRPTTIAAPAVALLAVSLAAPAVATPPVVYTDSVHVTGLSKHVEPTWGGDWVTVTGSGFTQPVDPVSAVWFGATRATHARVVDDGTIVAMDPEVDGRRRTVHVTVRLTNGASSRPTAADRFTFTVPTMRTPAHDGMSTLQSRARAAQVIWHVNRTPPAPLAPRTPSWTPAEGLSAVRRAERWLGMPYSWGGGDASGPTLGNPHGNGLLGRFDAMFRGFDCSGLVQHAWAPYQRLPHYAASQRAAGRFHPTVDELQPGDLLFFSGGGPVIGHVVIYAGAGQVVQAPESGHVVEMSSLDDVLALEPRAFGATRPATTDVVGPAPKITSLSTSQGTTAGGETLTIDGTDLDTTSSIRFGAQRTYAVTVVSPTEIQVSVPAGAAGTVSVRLGNAWGVSPDTPADAYTYVAPDGASDGASPGSAMAPREGRR